MKYWKEIRSYSNEELSRIEYTGRLKHAEVLWRKKHQHCMDIWVWRETLTAGKNYKDCSLWMNSLIYRQISKYRNREKQLQFACYLNRFAQNTFNPNQQLFNTLFLISVRALLTSIKFSTLRVILDAVCLSF